MNLEEYISVNFCVLDGPLLFILFFLGFSSLASSALPWLLLLLKTPVFNFWVTQEEGQQGLGDNTSVMGDVEDIICSIQEPNQFRHSFVASDHLISTFRTT